MDVATVISGLQGVDELRKRLAKIQEGLGRLKGTYVGCPECGDGYLCWRHTKVLHRLQDKQRAIREEIELLP